MPNAMEPIRIVGLGGSMRAPSASLAALDVALASARDRGAVTSRFAVHELDLPMYQPGVDPPAAAVELADGIGRADGLVWSSPLYHGSVSGSFKNALDWLQLLAAADPPYLTGKVVGLIAVAGGVQALQAVNTMEFIARALRAFAVPLVVPLPQAGRLSDEGRIDGAFRGQLEQLGREVYRAAGQLRGTGTCDYA
ncbi:MAG TPA: NADPH-dependent FMN reductase [Egibacteraceae bacterium]|nr:NADPH-dependent FMN reductase [Egibacteraceae bacterium]